MMLFRRQALGWRPIKRLARTLDRLRSCANALKETACQISADTAIEWTSGGGLDIERVEVPSEHLLKKLEKLSARLPLLIAEFKALEDVIWSDGKQPFDQAVLEVVKLKALEHSILRASTALNLWEEPCPPPGATLPSACIRADRLIEGQQVSAYAVFRMTHLSEYNAWRSNEPACREAIVHQAADEITTRLASQLQQS